VPPKELALEMVDLAYELEWRKRAKEPLVSSELMGLARQWRLVANTADPEFAAKHGYLAEGQCIDKTHKPCF
jgi:hypothetical protein